MAEPQRIALVWEQFAPYHVDRCAAVAARLGDRADVHCIEIAPASQTYAWDVSGDVPGAEKTVLFPGKIAENVSRPARYRSLRRPLESADLVVIGLPSSAPDIAWLARSLRRSGKRVYFCSDSKADDYPRSSIHEALKRVVLRSYDGGIVAGPRSRDYYCSLGVAREKLWPGYDTLSTARVRTRAADAAPLEWENRAFLFLGRFVEKKAVDVLLRAYAAYREISGEPRDLVLAGDGPLRSALEAQTQALGIARHVRWTGFLPESAAAQEMARALALVLPSREEQWGLVVNEAVALRIPVIASAQVGAVDLLVDEGRTGYVVETGSVPALTEALLAMAADKDRWAKMAAHSADKDWLADSERFADTIEAILFPNSGANRSVERLLEAFETP